MTKRKLSLGDGDAEPTEQDAIKYRPGNLLQFINLPEKLRTAKVAAAGIRNTHDLWLRLFLWDLSNSDSQVLRSPLVHRALVDWTIHQHSLPCSASSIPTSTPLLYCDPFKKAVYETLNLNFHLEVFKRGGKIPGELTPFIGEFLATGLNRDFCVVAAALYPAAKALKDAAAAPKKRAKK
jgi:hypothetical protein